MNDKQAKFRASAKAAGLTVKQLVKLCQLQSDLHHRATFMGERVDRNTPIEFGDIALDGRKMKPFDALRDKGFIDVFDLGRRATITAKGWATYCNAGPMLICFGGDDDFIEYEHPASKLV